MNPRNRCNSAGVSELTLPLKKNRFDLNRSHSANKAFDTSSSDEEKNKLVADNELNKLSAKEDCGSSEKEIEFREAFMAA